MYCCNVQKWRVFYSLLSPPSGSNCLTVDDAGGCALGPLEALALSARINAGALNAGKVKTNDKLRMSVLTK